MSTLRDPLVDSEEEIAATASSLRDHTKWLVRHAEETADMLERAGKELEVLRDVQWIVNRSTMDTGPGTAYEALKNARELVAIADAYLAWREEQGGTPGTPPHDVNAAIKADELAQETAGHVLVGEVCTAHLWEADETGVRCCVHCGVTDERDRMPLVERLRSEIAHRSLLLEAADRIEALEDALHLIAGTHGTETANPRWLAAKALAAPKEPS